VDRWEETLRPKPTQGFLVAFEIFYIAGMVVDLAFFEEENARFVIFVKKA
jgi:hypothetical protein